MSIPGLDSLLLYRKLLERAQRGDVIAKNLSARLEVSILGLARVLADIRVGFRQFTDHSVDHSFRICHNIGSLLEDRVFDGGGKRLSSSDIFLMIATALVHDIGMVISEDEYSTLLSDPDFQQWQHEHMYEGLSSGLGRQHICEYVRRRHPTRSLKMVLAGSLPESLTSNSPRLAFWIGTIAAAHGLDRQNLLDDHIFPRQVTINIDGSLQDSINPRFIALCLRLGDLLDIGTARVCPLLRGLSEPLSPLSRQHWDQYSDVEIRGLSPAHNITIAGTCPTQESERVLREWIQWLDAEVSFAVSAQNADNEPYHFRLGTVKYEVEPSKINGVPAYEFLAFRFNLDEKMVFERLFGQALYGRRELAIRELIQNAIDAQRAVAYHELTLKDPHWSNYDPSQKRQKLLAHIGENPDLQPITLTFTSSTDPCGTTKCELSISDRGIGMSRSTIEKYLLKVGRSRWAEDPDIRNLGLGTATIGTFGIGFLSALMIADKITIDTRSCLPDEKSLRATIYSWHGYLATQPSERVERGTTITLMLSDDWKPTDLAIQVAEMVPMPDFPIQIYCNGALVHVPQLSPKRSSYSRIVKLPHGDGSVVLYENRSYRMKDWSSQHSGLKSITEHLNVIQDGIAVSELGPSLDSAPEHQLLHSLGVIVSLAGQDRVPLDLSRNLVEGGSQAFWKKIVPQIWNGLASMADRDLFARRQLVRLGERNLHGSTDAFWPTIRTSDGRLAMQLPSLSECDVVLVDSHCSTRLKLAQKACWFLPGDPLVKIVAPQYAHYAPYLGHAEAGPEETEEDDDVNTNMQRWQEDDDESDSAPTARLILQRISQILNSIVHEDAYLSRTTEGLIVLGQSGPASIRDLLGFRATEQWYVIRNLATGQFSTVHASQFEEYIKLARHYRADSGVQLSLGAIFATSSFLLHDDSVSYSKRWKSPVTELHDILRSSFRLFCTMAGIVEDYGIDALSRPSPETEDDSDDEEAVAADTNTNQWDAEMLRRFISISDFESDRGREFVAIPMTEDFGSVSPVSLFLWLVTNLEVDLAEYASPWEFKEWQSIKK